MFSNVTTIIRTSRELSTKGMNRGKPTSGKTILSSSNGQLSAEQLQRMEDNRRKAQAKLAAKRAAAVPTHSSHMGGQPPAKKVAINTPTIPHTDWVTQSTTGLSRASCHGNIRTHPTSSKIVSSTASRSSISISIVQVPTNSNQPLSTCTSSIETTHAVTSSLQRPPFYNKIATNSNQRTTVTHVHHSTQKSAPFFNQPPTHANSLTVKQQPFHPKQTSTASTRPTGTITPTGSAVLPTATIQHSKLKEKKKARVNMVSRTRFQIIVQYDHDLIEIFKKIPTRAYSEFPVCCIVSTPAANSCLTQ